MIMLVGTVGGVSSSITSGSAIYQEQTASSQRRCKDYMCLTGYLNGLIVFVLYVLGKIRFRGI